MAVRKKSSRPSVASRASELASMKDLMGRNIEGLERNNVLLEEMRARQIAVAEGLVTMETSLTRRMDEGFDRLTRRIEILESVVEQNSADIKQNSADIKELREELARLRHDFDRREDLARIAALETRVTDIERKLRAG